MDGQPEGTAPPPRGRIRVLWVAAFLLTAFYLLFRLGQGVVWLTHHV